MKNLMLTAAVIALAAPAVAQTATDTTPAAEPPAVEAPVTEAPVTTEAPADAPVTEAPVTTEAPADAPAAEAPVTEAPVTEAPVADAPAVVSEAPADPAHADMGHASISAAQPGVTASWLTSRSIWTTNQPSTTAWVDVTATERPEEWEQIANVSDLILTDDGQLVGYTADIGGFLGIGGRTVMLDRADLHVVRFGDDAYLATNYSREELENMPEFDSELVHD